MNRASGQTLRIALALAGEFWAHGWRGILLGPLLGLSLPGMFWALEMSQGQLGLSFTRTILRLFPFYWITVLCLGSLIFPNLVNQRLRYTLPAPNWLLVAGPMACAMLTMFVHYAIVAMVVNVWLDAGWPIFAPGLLAAVMIAWCQAVVWSTSNSLALPFLVCLSTFLTFIFATARWTPSHGPTMPEFFSGAGVCQVLAFGLAALVCLGIGSVGFASQRCGSGIDGKRILDWLSDRLYVRPQACEEPFPSPSSAQFWLEWNGRGYVLPLGALLIGVGGILLALSVPARILTASITDGVEFVGGVSAFWITPTFLIAIFWGNRSPTFEFGPFAGSRPLADRQIAGAVLKSATLGLVSSAVLWAACLAVVYWIVSVRREAPIPHRALEQPGTLVLLAGVALGATAVWSFLAFVASLSLAGRKALGIALALAMGAWAAGVVLAQCLEESRSTFVGDYFVAWLVLGLTGCAAAFIAAWRRRLISLPAFCLAGAIVVTAVAAAHLVGIPFEWKNWPIVVCCCLLPLPLAAAPLAVCLNRHR